MMTLPKEILVQILLGVVRVVDLRSIHGPILKSILTSIWMGDSHRIHELTKQLLSGFVLLISS
jgi:hypothetical protein